MSKHSLSKLSKTVSYKYPMKSERVVDVPIDMDDELGNLVTQCEQNSYSILSIKQKFDLVGKNSASFQEEANEKLSHFSELIDSIEKKCLTTFQSYTSRLDRMEVLSFRP